METPESLSAYPEGSLRLAFLDLTPDRCWEFDAPQDQLIQPGQVAAAASFIRTIHLKPTPVTLIIHCEVGENRSAAVALVASAFAGVELRRDTRHANPYVAALLAQEMGVQANLVSADNPPD